MDEEFVRAVVVADDLSRRAQEAGTAYTQLASVDAIGVAVAGAIDAAGNGQDPTPALDGLADHRRQTADAAARHEAAQAAARHAGNVARQELRNGTDQLGAVLAAALSAVLEEARKPAHTVAGARAFSYTDPSALHAAPKAVQDAFAALIPLAARHDAIRQAAVALSTVEKGWDDICDPDALPAIRAVGLGAFTDWPRAGGFAGYGVQLVQRGQGAPVWAWQPTGHPVQNLVAAATASTPEPLVQPEDRRPRAERRL